jgi:hypothetical protein
VDEEKPGKEKGKGERARWSGRWGINYLVTLLQVRTNGRESSSDLEESSDA